jgi:hypothetical protein
MSMACNAIRNRHVGSSKKIDATVTARQRAQNDGKRAPALTTAALREHFKIQFNGVVGWMDLRRLGRQDALVPTAVEPPGGGSVITGSAIGFGDEYP